MKNIYTVLLAIALAFSDAAFADQLTDLEACYGETIEIKMPSRFGDGIETEYTYFSLPAPNAWLIRIGPNELLDDVPCGERADLAEPIETASTWRGYFSRSLGHEPAKVSLPEGIRLHTLRIGSPYLKVYLPFEQRRENRILNEGSRTADGFVRRASVDENAVGGGWLFPEDYLSPIGTRIEMRCTTKKCSVEYRIDRNLKVTYEFLIPSPDKTYDWIAIDQVLRSMVLEWKN